MWPLASALAVPDQNRNGAHVLTSENFFSTTVESQPSHKSGTTRNFQVSPRRMVNAAH